MSFTDGYAEFQRLLGIERLLFKRKQNEMFRCQRENFGTAEDCEYDVLCEEWEKVNSELKQFVVQLN